MRWLPEMEEKFIDLDIMEKILEDKRTIRGNFTDGIYIKERKTDFEKAEFLNGEIKIYLPIGKVKKEHYGKKFIYPEVMGIYEEYVSEDERFAFTIEKFITDSGDWGKIGFESVPEAEKIKEYISDNIQEKFENTVITEISDYDLDHIQISILMAEGILEENAQEIVGYIFLILYQSQIYRFYIMAEDELWEIIYKLGKKIIQNVEI